MVVKTFWRFEPPVAGEPTASINSATLSEPADFVAKLKLPKAFALHPGIPTSTSAGSRTGYRHAG
jgi:hypothetical protein